MQPTSGQGAPLPDFLKCPGEWIIEGHIFLYYSDDQSETGVAPRFTRGASRHDGQPCIGFDVAQLAAAFDLDVAAVLTANHDQSLICRGTARTRAAHGGTSARVYAFRIGDRDAYLTIETNNNEGVA